MAAGWPPIGPYYPDRRLHTTTLGWIKPGSPAEVGGLKPGDTIKAIDGVEVSSWDEPINSIIERIAFAKNPKIAFTVETGNLGSDVFVMNRDGSGRVNLTNRPGFYLALTSLILGMQLFLAGFIGELISRNAPGRNSYIIEKKTGL